MIKLFEIIETSTFKHYDGNEYIEATLYSIATKENDNMAASSPKFSILKTPRSEKSWKVGRRVSIDMKLT